MAVSDSDSGLCSKHLADRQKELDQADLAPVLIGDVQEFRDAVAINHSLGELCKLQARNKITPRRAAVMAYTASLLLRTSRPSRATTPSSPSKSASSSTSAMGAARWTAPALKAPPAIAAPS